MVRQEIGQSSFSACWPPKKGKQGGPLRFGHKHGKLLVLVRIIALANWVGKDQARE